MPSLAEHVVAVLGKLRHLVGNGQVAQTQHFGNVDPFWAGQAGVALGAAAGSQAFLLGLAQPLLNLRAIHPPTVGIL
jgi:hypothetical protein